MVLILVGAVARIINSSIISPSSLIFYALIFIFITAAILHPREFTCLFPSALYFVCSPSAFILLNIYALMNLNNVSWGTRETKATIDATKPSSNRSRILRYMNRALNLKSNRKRTYSVTKTENSVKTIEKKLELVDDACIELKSLLDDGNMAESENFFQSAASMLPVSWFDHSSLEEFKEDQLNQSEKKFFEQLIHKYLMPLDPKKEAIKKEKMTEGLKTLRNVSCFYFLLLNSFWILTLFTIQIFKDKLKDRVYIKVNFYGINESYEPISFCYVMMFVVMLIIQFLAMLWHRTITLIQIIRKTRILKAKKLKIDSIRSAEEGKQNTTTTGEQTDQDLIESF